jgi:nucleotide-binding universal stress UspA family protein
MSIKRILFPTDLSEPAGQARDYAVALAKTNEAELMLYHVVVTHEHEFRQLGQLLSAYLKTLEKDAEERLSRDVKALSDEGVQARWVVRSAADAYRGIMEEVESYRPEIIVMATHGAKGVAHWFMGSVAEKVVRHADCPVMTVRPRLNGSPIQPIQRVLAPVDFSDSSKRAVAVAREVSGDHAELVLLHVVINPAFAGVHPGELVRIFEIDPELPARIRARMQAWMEGQAFEAEVRESEDIASVVLDVAKQRRAGMIAMGTRGLTGAKYFLLGSVAEKVVRASTIPVLTVK